MQLSISGTFSCQKGSLRPSVRPLRGWIVSSRGGKLGSWLVHGTAEATDVDPLDVRAGDTLDFVVEGRGSEPSSGFEWTVVLKPQDGATGSDGKPEVWDSTRNFGDSPSNHRSYGPRERFAQVLLEANELVFID